MNIQCTKCHEFKEDSLFGDRVEKDNGKRSECLECAEKGSSNWRNNNQDRVKENKRIQYLRKRDLQTRKVSSSCDICKNPFDLTVQIGAKKANSPHWDHNHKTEKFRGWLCHSCNTLLGHAGDNIEILKRAIDYLQIHGVCVSKFIGV